MAVTTHPWFGRGCLSAPEVPAGQLRQVMAREIADTGIPPRPMLPAAPFLLPRSSYAELFRAGWQLLDLLRRAVLQCAPTTSGRLSAYGVTEAEYPLFIDDQVLEEHYASCMARPDVIIGPTGPKFLEFNVSGVTGGTIELHTLLRGFSSLYRRRMHEPFEVDDPLAARGRMFRDICADRCLPPRVVLVGSVRDLKHTSSSRYFDLELESLHRQGFIAEHAEPEMIEDLAASFPLGLRHFTVPEWLDLGIDLAPVQSALKQGCLLLSTQTAAFLANKKTLGLVSEGQPWMSAADHHVARRYLPWTRILGDRGTEFADQRIDLLEHVIAHQESLVLKRGIGMQGLQVTLGSSVTPENWRSEVERATAAGDSIVQEYVESERCPVELSPSDDDPDPHRVEVAPVLSPFLFGRHRGGVWTRFFATGASGVVSREGYGALENAAVAEA